MNSNFYDPDQWAYSSRLIDAFHDIVAEYNKFPKELQTLHTESKIQVDGVWKQIVFLRKGKVNTSNCKAFPAVQNLIDTLPIYDNCMISVIGPNSKIHPHPGHSDRHLRVHLCLHTSGGSYIKIGNEQQEWHSSKVMIFQDSEIHEVTNTALYERVVLLFDIKREDYFDNFIK
jgi:aspartyl/asparaginyl beta-hydroxylase (cupin superfamily)